MQIRDRMAAATPCWVTSRASAGGRPRGSRALHVLAAALVVTAFGCSARPSARAPSLDSQRPGGAGPTAAGAGTPSASARMICGPEIARDVAASLGLGAVVVPSSRWAEHTYTCTYRLPGGPLVMSVQEAPDAAGAQVYVTSLQRRLAPTESLPGMQGLGLPAFQNDRGHVVFTKDDKTLHVDASALGGELRGTSRSATALAYQLATDVLGCWTGA